jgi:hypothetical protein
MNINFIKQKFRRVFSILLSGVVGAAACHTAAPYHKNSAHADDSDAAIAHGEMLAAKYCQSCHKLPAPDELDATSWEKGVLPQMGPRLGIFEYKGQRYPNSSMDANVGRDFYPPEPLMTADEWGDVITYYASLAPDSLKIPPRTDALKVDTTRFRIIKAGRTKATGPEPPATCFIQFDSSLGQVVTSDIIGHSITRWDRNLRPLTIQTVPGSVVAMAGSTAGRLVCNIGAFQPNNALAGTIDRWEPASATFKNVVGGLKRPVHMAVADLNGDGREDIVVCEFGYLKGELSWWENKGNGMYEKHVLRNTPGAIRVIINDYNKDGRPDIWALFAQGEEGIFFYANKGGGRFEEHEVLRFPPSYGSTYFELTDLDGDGRKEILYTCGDNGDFSTVLKPYHGVYIFKEDSVLHFMQRYFFPMNGCYRAMAVDVDRDGRPDIAAIAYFADCDHHPEEGFVYLHHKTGLEYEGFTVPGTEIGRWITMDIRDIDGDGRPDILLANCSVGPAFNRGQTDWKKGPPFIVLKNNAK